MPIRPPHDSHALRRASVWEFWPPWAFYAPVALWVAWLAVRYGLRSLTAANPGLPDGGLVGESKADILERLPSEWTIPFVFVAPGPVDARLSTISDVVCSRGWAYPVVAKPDVGQRGVGVRRIETPQALGDYLRAYDAPIVLQPWHPGPFEAGIFYWRQPGEARGRIFSITDKVFPFVVGDGHSTLDALVRAHPRFRRQARVFLRRHEAIRATVVPLGEVVRLGEVGNHAQGTMFQDGPHLITPALEARIDSIAHCVPGFFIGRFDVRYRDVDAFKAGEDLAIVELNGVTAESTNIYDPSRSLLAAYRTLFKQWRLVFEIGAANRARGAEAVSPAHLWDLSLAHLRDRRRFPVAS